MGRHRARLTIGGIVAAIGLFALAGFFTGIFESFGEKAADRGIGLLPSAAPSGPLSTSPKSPAVPIDIQLETDRTKFQVRPSQWSVPGNTTLPKFNAGCFEIDEWAKSIPDANELSPVYRVTMTGTSDAQVVIHRVWAKIVSRAPMPPGWLTLSCPQGGSIGSISASLKLSDPSATTYADENDEQIPRLTYSLARGEAGVFYVQVFNHAEDKLQTTWDLMIDLTVGSKSLSLNLNSLKLDGKHFQQNSSCNTTGYEAGETWTNYGLNRC